MGVVWVVHEPQQRRGKALVDLEDKWEANLRNTKRPAMSAMAIDLIGWSVVMWGLKFLKNGGRRTNWLDWGPPYKMGEAQSPWTETEAESVT